MKKSVQKCQQYANLYNLKQKASQHIAKKKYSWATVYLVDVLKQFQQKIEEIDDADKMQKLIKDIKLPCHKNLSLCYMKQNNYQAAIQQCKNVLQIEPNCVKILYRIGISYMNINGADLIKAESYLKKAYMLDPNEKQVMKALQQIQYKRKEGNKQQVSKSNMDVRSLLKYIFFWPLIILMYLYKRLVPQKLKII